jgi:hypothetical protein
VIAVVRFEPKPFLDISPTTIAVPSLLVSFDSVSRVEYPAGR